MQRSLLALLCLSIAAPTAAQVPAGLTLSLDEAIARALDRAPGVAEARARERAAASRADAGAALRVPMLSTGLSFLRTNHVDEFFATQPDGSRQVIFPDIPSNYRWRVEAAIPIYLAGRDQALVDNAEAEGRAAAAEGRVAEADVRLAVATAYWQAVTTARAVGVREQALARTDAWVGDVGARVDVGLLPPNDVLTARAERARQLVQLIEARAAAAVASVELAQLIGVDVSTTFELTTPVGQPATAAADLVSAPAADVVAAARERRGERAALDARAEALLASARASDAATRPTVSAIAAFEPSRPNRRFVPPTDTWDTSWDLGVTVNWTFFDGGRARAERAAARAQADALAERVRDFDDRLAVDVRRRQLDVESARAALAAAGDGVTAAAEARRVVGERFSAGVATSTDVLDAEVALLDAELGQTRLAAALRLAEARLLRVAGDRP